MRSTRRRSSQLSVEFARTLRGDRRGHRAEFLVLRDEVAQVLQDGYSIRTVHDQLRMAGRVSFGYDTFRRYVLKYIPASERRPPDADPPEPACCDARPSPAGHPVHSATPVHGPAPVVGKGKPYEERDPLDPPDLSKYP